MDEKIDILDKSGRPTGEVKLKSEAHRLGLWHRCFHCWISGEDDAGVPYLLVQRRAAGKETWPGRLDVTVAGHLAAGEEPLDGLREMEEEIGLRPDPARLIPLGTRRVEHEISQGFDREFHDVYLLLDSTDPGDMRLQREEVEAVLSIDLDEFEKLGDGETVSAREWSKDGPAEVRVSLPDFVPDDHGYLPWVTRAVRRVRGGEDPGEL